MKLYLDDVRPLPDSSWTLALTAGDAILAILAIKSPDIFEAASLDHDLGLNDGNGMDVVEWMVKTRNWPLQKPTVHSANFHAAKDMRALIDRTGPYRADGTRGFIKKAPRLHPTIYNDGHGSHMICPDTACCHCPCPGCMYEWRAAGKPTESDCEVHLERF